VNLQLASINPVNGIAVIAARSTDSASPRAILLPRPYSGG